MSPAAKEQKEGGEGKEGKDGKDAKESKGDSKQQQTGESKEKKDGSGEGLDYGKSSEELRAQLAKHVHIVTQASSLAPGWSTRCAELLCSFVLLLQADVSANRYTMADVVMPLPGHAVTYPTHQIGAM